MYNWNPHMRGAGFPMQFPGAHLPQVPYQFQQSQWHHQQQQQGMGMMMTPNWHHAAQHQMFPQHRLQHGHMTSPISSMMGGLGPSPPSQPPPPLPAEPPPLSPKAQPTPPPPAQKETHAASQRDKSANRWDQGDKKQSNFSENEATPDQPRPPQNPAPDLPRPPQSPAPDQPKPPQSPAPDQPKPPQSPAPGQPKPPQSPAPGQPKPPQSPAPGQPKPPQSPAPGQPKPPQSPAPGQPKPPQSPAPGQPKPSQSPVTCQPKPTPSSAPNQVNPRGPTPNQVNPRGPTPNQVNPRGPTPNQVNPRGPTPNQVNPLRPGLNKFNARGSSIQINIRGPVPNEVTPQGPGPNQANPTGPVSNQVNPAGSGSSQINPSGPGPNQVISTGPGSTQVNPSGLVPKQAFAHGAAPGQLNPRGQAPNQVNLRGPTPNQLNPTGLGPNQVNPRGSAPVQVNPRGPTPNQANSAGLGPNQVDPYRPTRGQVSPQRQVSNQVFPRGLAQVNSQSSSQTQANPYQFQAQSQSMHHGSTGTQADPYQFQTPSQSTPHGPGMINPSHSTLPGQTKSASFQEQDQIPPSENTLPDPVLVAELEKVKVEEGQFMEQYKQWKQQYDDWREQNQNHPNKQQFEQYLDQWRTYEQQMEIRRKNIQVQKQNIEDKLARSQAPPAIPQTRSHWDGALAQPVQAENKVLDRFSEPSWNREGQQVNSRENRPTPHDELSGDTSVNTFQRGDISQAVPAKVNTFSGRSVHQGNNSSAVKQSFYGVDEDKGEEDMNLDEEEECEGGGIIEGGQHKDRNDWSKNVTADDDPFQQHLGRGWDSWNQGHNSLGRSQRLGHGQSRAEIVESAGRTGGTGQRGGHQGPQEAVGFRGRAGWNGSDTGPKSALDPDLPYMDSDLRLSKPAGGAYGQAGDDEEGFNGNQDEEFGYDFQAGRSGFGGPWQRGRGNDLQRGRGAGYLRGRGGQFLRGRGGEFQMGRGGEFQMGRGGEYEMGRGGESEMGRDGELQMGRRGEFQMGMGGEFQMGRGGEFQMGRGGEYEMGRGGEYEMGRDGEFQMGRGGEFQMGRGGEYEMGRGGEFDMGMDGEFQMGRRGEFQRGRGDYYRGRGGDYFRGRGGNFPIGRGDFQGGRRGDFPGGVGGDFMSEDGGGLSNNSVGVEDFERFRVPSRGRGRGALPSLLEFEPSDNLRPRFTDSETLEDEAFAEYNRNTLLDGQEQEVVRAREGQRFLNRDDDGDSSDFPPPQPRREIGAAGRGGMESGDARAVFRGDVTDRDSQGDLSLRLGRPGGMNNIPFGDGQRFVQQGRGGSLGGTREGALFGGSEKLQVPGELNLRDDVSGSMGRPEVDPDRPGRMWDNQQEANVIAPYDRPHNQQNCETAPGSDLLNDRIRGRRLPDEEEPEAKKGRLSLDEEKEGPNRQMSMYAGDPHQTPFSDRKTYRDYRELYTEAFPGRPLPGFERQIPDRFGARPREPSLERRSLLPTESIDYGHGGVARDALVVKPTEVIDYGHGQSAGSKVVSLVPDRDRVLHGALAERPYPDALRVGAEVRASREGHELARMSELMDRETSLRRPDTGARGAHMGGLSRYGLRGERLSEEAGRGAVPGRGWLGDSGDNDFDSDLRADRAPLRDRFNEDDDDLRRGHRASRHDIRDDRAGNEAKLYRDQGDDRPTLREHGLGSRDRDDYIGTKDYYGRRGDVYGSRLTDAYVGRANEYTQDQGQFPVEDDYVAPIRDGRYGSSAGDVYSLGDRSRGHALDRDVYSRAMSPPAHSTPPLKASTATPLLAKSETVKVEDLLCPPNRASRPPQIVTIIRGLPGSGKTYTSKLLREKEISCGGAAPRMLCLDDYFMVEAEREVVEPDTGRRVKKRGLEYEYEQALEEPYRQSLLKSFKKTVDDGFFPFIIVDATNEKVAHFSEFWSYAKSKGFQVYVGELNADVPMCIQRNIHNWTEWDIEKVKNSWEPLPSHYIRLDLRWLLQEDSIPEVIMEDTQGDDEGAVEDAVEDDEESDLTDVHTKSKWELDTSGETLDKLDGIRVSKKHIAEHQSLNEYLQLDQMDDDYFSRESLPGKKRVRWADLEEKKNQSRRRNLGFIVGQTQQDWERITDDDLADKALNQTKYFYKN